VTLSELCHESPPRVTEFREELLDLIQAYANHVVMSGRLFLHPMATEGNRDEAAKAASTALTRIREKLA